VYHSNETNYEQLIFLQLPPGFIDNFLRSDYYKIMIPFWVVSCISKMTAKIVNKKKNLSCQNIALEWWFPIRLSFWLAYNRRLNSFTVNCFVISAKKTHSSSLLGSPKVYKRVGHQKNCPRELRIHLVKNNTREISKLGPFFNLFERCVHWELLLRIVNKHLRVDFQSCLALIDSCMGDGDMACVN